LGPGVSRHIRSILTDKEIQHPIRIDLQFSGCCDASLGLRVDSALATDLTQVIDGLEFIIDADAYQLVGEVTITYVDEIGKKGFILTSEKPISEWEGLCATDIKT
jgi:Fe-S cluster assembly iron-binding protein IscA